MATALQIQGVTSQINNLITDQHNEEITGTILNSVLHAIKALAPVCFPGTFLNTDLDADFNIEIEHGLNTSHPDVSIKDNNGRVLTPTNFELYIIDANNIRVGMGAAITGTYSYKISKND
jgi:hypothetical protein